MKVLHIINNLNIGGAEKLLVETLPLYESFGVQVDVFLLTKVDSPFVSAIEENFNGNIYYSGLKSVYNPCQILKDSLELDETPLITRYFIDGGSKSGSEFSRINLLKLDENGQELWQGYLDETGFHLYSENKS